MTAVLTKLADQLDPGDIQALIAESVPEGVQVEFKESLPAKGSGDPDPWIQGEGSIGNRARNEILREVVAFANAYGGVLVLGIAESRSKPPVAATVTPLPRCAELAERFRQVFGVCVDPPLPTLDIVSVPTDGEEGIIVLRTSRSRRGPHRVKPTLECPIRRDDRCEALSMREVQDMTLNLARGMERLERRLQERSRRFEETFKRLETPDDAFGFRMTAVPMGDEIRFESVYSGGNLIKELHPPEITIRRTEITIRRRLNDPVSRLRTLKMLYGMHFRDWRPMLRAARVEEDHHWNRSVTRYAYAEVHADGLLEWGFVSNRLVGVFPENPEVTNLDSETPVSTLTRLLVWADHVRQQASAPGADYAIQPQFRVKASSVNVTGDDYRSVVGSIKQNDTDFPMYALETSDEIDKTVSRFERDFWNYFGKDPGSRVRKPLLIVQT